MDRAHRYADKKLAEMIGDMTSIFEDVDRKVIERMKKYLQKFEKEIKEHEKMVDEGFLTEREFEQWFSSRILSGKQWKKVRDEIVEDYENSFEEALKNTGKGLAAIYVYNHNYTSSSLASMINKYTGKKYNFGKRKRKILPPSPDPVKNRYWHRKKIESVIRSGIKKGYGIDKIAKKLHRITNMDRVAAYRAARTGVTAAENMARIDAMAQAEGFGTSMDKIWMATMDERTRTEHRIINGERVPYDQEFSNGLMYPGDESGEPEEVYNCRCTLGWAPAGMNIDIRQAPEGMGPLEWVATKPVSKPYPKWRKE